MLQQFGQNIDVSNSAWGLHGENVVTPPWAGSPPDRASPNISVVAHVIKATFQSSNTDRIVASCKLTNDALFLVCSQPGRSGNQAVCEDGAVDAGGACATTVRVEILMHLIYQLVLCVHQSAHGVAIRQTGSRVDGRGPCPGAAPRIAFRGDVLRVSTHRADAGDGSLVQVEDERLRHIVVFVVGVEHHEGVAFVGRCHGLPKGLESSSVSDDIVVITTV